MIVANGMIRRCHNTFNNRYLSSTVASASVASTLLWNKQIELAPPDKILGLTDAFKSDLSTNKVNLGVGAYRNDYGKPVVLPSVRIAEERIYNSNVDHEYTTITGISDFVKKSIEFAYGENSTVISTGCVAAVQSISGTGACRLSGEFIAKVFGRGTKIYISDPTWGNHISIFKNSGLEPVKYTYYDPKNNCVNFHGMVNDINNAPDYSVFLLHACAHNPTGCDPTKSQWDELSKRMKAKNHIILFDSAYQGFASGDAEEDAYAIRKFVSDGHHIMLCQSYAKNFGLYGERIGALSIVTANKDLKERTESQLKLLARPMYSTPPIHGARLISIILNDEVLKKQWISECKNMADRIKSMRQLLRNNIESSSSNRSWKHITDQIGMFCYTGLTPTQVERLKTEYHIYCTEDGRFSMCGITTSNVKYIANAVLNVTK